MSTTTTTAAHLTTPEASREPERPKVALVTGGSRGLGRALVAGLWQAGWSVVTDGRDAHRLAATARAIEPPAHDDRPDTIPVPELVAIAGDQGDAAHRFALLDATRQRGGVSLLVLNAGDLGPSPLPRLADLAPSDLAAVLHANVVAPHALVRDALPQLRASHGTVIAITSDASAEAYEGWGGYGASKAALEHLARVLAEEEPDVTVLRVDPGDLRTDMHQAAFPGEDISDRPAAEAAVPGLLALAARPPATGTRWRAQGLADLPHAGGRTGDEPTGHEATDDETTCNQPTGHEATHDETTGNQPTGHEATDHEPTGHEPAVDRPTGQQSPDDRRPAAPPGEAARSDHDASHGDEEVAP